MIQFGNASLNIGVVKGTCLSLLTFKKEIS
jgi:hypothetical protein